MIAAKNNDTTLDQLARMMAEGFARMENRFDAIDIRFEAVDQRFEDVDQRFNILAKEVMRLSDDMYDVKNNLNSLIDMHVEQESVVSRIDQRVTLLETGSR